VETINCKHVGQGHPGQEPNGKSCRRVAFRNLFYCYAHKHLHQDAETRTEYEKRRKTLSEEGPEPRTDSILKQEGGSVPPDWDVIQNEEGWWDDALPDATPEERKKEALANAEVAKRSLKAEEIYTVVSLGGEVTDEMFGRNLQGSIITNAFRGIGMVFLIPLIPLALTLQGGGEGAIDFSVALAVELWKPPFFAVAAAFGAFSGFSNHQKRTEALARGKADFITSQEGT